MTFKTQKSQAGVAHLAFIILVVAVLATVGFVGLRVAKKSNGAKSSSSSSVASVAGDKAVESECNKQVKDKDLCKFASHYSLDKVAYKATTSSTSKSDTSTSTMEVDGKGNSTMTVSEAGKETSAFVYLNGASYVKNSQDGSWTKYPAQQSSELKDSEPTNDVKIDTKDFTEKNTMSYKLIGKEACGSKTCFKYQVVDTTQPNDQDFFWFDNKDYMMQRWSHKDADGSMDMVISYQAVTIKEPSPVHEFSASNQADINAALQAAQQASGGDDTEQ
jgi:outer membrane lipoprotein-sorting protein